MGAVVTVNPKLPEAIKKLMALAGQSASTELSGGVQGGFPVISYKGKVWRIRQSGDEHMHLDGDGNAMPTIDVVLVQANPTLSKIHYAGEYVEGSNEPPRCFSNDGVKPDVSVTAPINPVCATCPKNAWGSKMMPSGKKGKACQDARRMAVVFAEQLYNDGVDAPKYLLRAPPASLVPLKDYHEKVLAPKGLPFYAMVTRIGFNPESAHPEFTFKAIRFLNDDEAEAIGRLRGSPEIMRILAEAQDFAAGGTAQAQPEPEPEPQPEPEPEIAAPPPKKASKPAVKPVAAEEAGEAVAAPPQKKASNPAAGKANGVAKPVAAAKPAQKAAPVSSPVDEAAEETAAAAPEGDEFENLLDSILGT